MFRALWTSASGMTAQQTNLDVISHNMANVNTVGFKKMRATFQDLIYQTIRDPGAPTSPATRNPSGFQVGLGVMCRTLTASLHRVISSKRVIAWI